MGLCSIFAMFYGETGAMMQRKSDNDPWVKESKSVRRTGIYQDNLLWEINSAMDKNLYDFVKILTKVASQNHFKGWTKKQKANLLFYAVENCLEEVVLYCAKENKLKDIEDYADNGFDLDMRDQYGKTPLLIATAMGYNSIAECLLEYGADPNAADIRRGFSSLMIASYVGNKRLVNKLIEYKADVNALSHWGCSPLSLAMGNNHANITRILIKAGADAYLVNQNGDTPLSIALYYRQKLAESIEEKAKWDTIIKILKKWNKHKKNTTVIKTTAHSFFRSLFRRNNQNTKIADIALRNT